MAPRHQRHTTAEDLPHLVRATYSTTMKQRRDDTAAFERAVETVLNHLPRLSLAKARREVALMLATEPAADWAEAAQSRKR